jgi:hypothetical protein
MPTVDADTWTRQQVDCAWHFDGQRMQPAGVNRLEKVPEPRPFATVCEQLRQQPGIIAVQGVAYAVKPHAPR